MKPPRSSLAKHAKTLEVKVADLENDNAQLLQSCEQLVQAYDALQHQFKQFQRHRFGQRSEAYVDPNNPQRLLFGDPDDESSSNKDDNKKDKSKKNVIKIKEHG